jgi:DNA-binding transcriptional regulator YiaG
METSTSTHSNPPGALSRALHEKRREDISDLIATLQAQFDPEVRGDFQALINAATAYGVTPTQLAEEFAVSTATISRWGRGAVVPSVFVRRNAIARITELLTAEIE